MDCEKATEMMDDYLENELVDSDIQDLMAHLKDCEQCTALFDELKKLDSTLHQIPELEVPDGLHQSIMDKIKTEKKGFGRLLPRLLPKQFPMRKFSYVAAVLLCLLVVSTFVRNGVRYNYDFIDDNASLSSQEAQPKDLYLEAPEMAGYDSVEYEEDGYNSAVYDTGAEAPMAGSGISAISRVAGDTAQVQDNRKIIKSASISIDVDDFDAAIMQIRQFAADTDGYVENYSSYVYASSYYENIGQVDLKNGSITVKIPSNAYDNAVNKVSAIGHVTNINEYAEDVTASYIDTQARLETKKTEEARLLDMIDKAVNIEDLIALENRLNSVREDIESREALIQNWDRLVRYSTIDIYLSEVDNTVYTITPSTLSSRVSGGMQRSFNNTVRSFENLIVYIALNIVPLSGIAIVALIAAFVLFVRKRKAKYKDKG